MRPHQNVSLILAHRRHHAYHHVLSIAQAEHSSNNLADFMLNLCTSGQGISRVAIKPVHFIVATVTPARPICTASRYESAHCSSRFPATHSCVNAPEASINRLVGATPHNHLESFTAPNHAYLLDVSGIPYPAHCIQGVALSQAVVSAMKADTCSGDGCGSEPSND